MADDRHEGGASEMLVLRRRENEFVEIRHVSGDILRFKVYDIRSATHRAPYRATLPYSSPASSYVQPTPPSRPAGLKIAFRDDGLSFGIVRDDGTRSFADVPVFRWREWEWLKVRHRLGDVLGMRAYGIEERRTPQLNIAFCDDEMKFEMTRGELAGYRQDAEKRPWAVRCDTHCDGRDEPDMPA